MSLYKNIINLFIIPIIINYWKLSLTHAQIFSLEGLSPPPPKTILMHPYQFFVHDEKEIPINIFSLKNMKQPELIFENIMWETNEKNILLDYESMELSIVPSEDLENFLKNDGVIGACCNKEDVLREECLMENTFSKPKINGWISIRFKSQPVNFSMPLEKGGIYTFIISNCGNSNEGYFKGSVIVKNIYGYLPAIDYMKINLYFFGAIFYIALSIFWLYKCIINSKQLINIQYYMGGIIIISLFDSTMWFYFFKNWNNTGTQSILLFLLSTMFNMLKSTLIIMFTLIASHGVGISVSSLKTNKKFAITFIGLIYFVSLLLKEFVTYLKTVSTDISLSLMLMSIFPVGILNGLIFFWVFYELVNLINNLEDGKQTEKLYLYRRFMYILFLVVVIAICFFLVELKLFNSSINKRWKYQWILQDAIPFLYTTLLQQNLLWLWNPKENSKKYLTATEIPGIVIELEPQEIKNQDHLFENEKTKFCNKKSWDGHIDIPEDISDDGIIEISHLKLKNLTENIENELVFNNNLQVNQFIENQEFERSNSILKHTTNAFEKENLQIIINRSIASESPSLRKKLSGKNEPVNIDKVPNN